MKARIAPPSELILAYGTPQHTTSVAEIAEDLGAEFCEITEKMLDDALSVCIRQGQRGTAGGNTDFSGDAAIIFHGFTRKRLDEALGKIAVLKIPLKAVVTQQNQSWTVRTLLSELAKERAYFAAANRQRTGTEKTLHQQSDKE